MQTPANRKCKKTLWTCTQTHTGYTRGEDYKCIRRSESRWHQNMQKRLCRRPEIFNDESIHYRIRSLCFCCHEMYTFIISPPRTGSIVPLLQTTLDGKFIKRKKKKITNTHKHRQVQTCILAHISASPRTANIHTMKYFSKPRFIRFITPFKRHGTKSHKTMSFCACRSAVSYPYQRPNQIYEPVMKHFMLIVFVYEQINGSRAKRMMMWAHTQHDRIPEEFISCLQVIRGNN